MEAARLRRRTPPEDTTGRHSLPPPAPVPEKLPSNDDVAKWIKILLIVGTAVIAIVAGTLRTVGWLDDRMQDHLKPVEYRLGEMDKKLDRLLDQ